jgi:hypothetical protein
MRWVRLTSFLLLCVLTAGCTFRRHVQVDFPDPLFDLDCGPVTLIALPSSTVLQVGGSYFILCLPFYVPLLLVAAVVGLWLTWGRSKHAPEH